MATLKEEKEKMLIDVLEAEYNQDCSDGLTGYRTAVYYDENNPGHYNPEIRKDIDDDTVSANEFCKRHLKEYFFTNN